METKFPDLKVTRVVHKIPYVKKTSKTKSGFFPLEFVCSRFCSYYNAEIHYLLMQPLCLERANIIHPQSWSTDKRSKILSSISVRLHLVYGTEFCTHVLLFFPLRPKFYIQSKFDGRTKNYFYNKIFL